MNINILYEDADILVCVKPAGTASQTKQSLRQDMVSLLRNYRHAKNEEPYIGLVHRLDQPVEGILAFGKHAKKYGSAEPTAAAGRFFESLSGSNGRQDVGARRNAFELSEKRRTQQSLDCCKKRRSAGEKSGACVSAVRDR